MARQSAAPAPGSSPRASPRNAKLISSTKGAVVWGAVPEILIAGFDTLVEAGISPEVAFLECVGELKLIAELIEQRGIAGMREAISNTAELGAVLGGPTVVDGEVRRKMREVLDEVRSGRFAKRCNRRRTPAIHYWKRHGRKPAAMRSSRSSAS